MGSFFTGDGVTHDSTPSSLKLNAKTEQLQNYIVRVPADGTKHISVFNGAPVDNLDSSLKSGARGPISISDQTARERISHFDHERIPERVVHARGAGAHGEFTLHTSLSDVTCAKVLTETGKTTPVFVRFSTVLGSNGAAETAREVRGFATKFYTEDGNWDIVGNSVPVFFIQDGIKFVDLIHAGKPEPHIHLPQAQTAHDSFWDWISLTPESTHMIAWILSDHTIPRSYRMIGGFSVNTFVLVAANGKRTFVKFHWKPHLGKHGLVWDEALKLAGQDPDYHRRDLAEAIEAGAYPKYELGVQLIPEEDEDKFDFDLLDCTKLVPEELVPIKWVGTMTLNRNPTNYFAETEQVAYCTSNIVPGIDYSNDPMLQLRNFSYFDTQLSRLGGPNFSQIPINRSRCPFVTTARDGFHSHFIPAQPHYHPNRFDLPKVAQMDGANYATSDEKVYKDNKPNPDFQTFAPYKVEPGVFGRQRGPKFAEVVNQAQLFYNSQSPVEQQHIIEAAQFELGRVDDRGIQERMMARFAEIDYDMALQVAEGFGLDVPKPEKPNHGKKTTGSNPFSMTDPNNDFTATGRKVGIFALDGFDSTQVATLKAAFLAIGIVPMIIGARKGPAFPKGVKKGDTSASGVLPTNFTIEGARSTLFDGLFFPDGDEAYAKSLEQGRVIHYVREAYGHYKTIGAAGVAVSWLAHKCLPGNLDVNADATKSVSSNKGLVMGQRLSGDDTSFIGKITKGSYDAATYLGAYCEALKQHRHWDRDVSTVAF